MDFFNRFGAGNDQVIVAAVILLAAELLRGEVHFLQVGTHGAIKDEDTPVECIQVAAVGVISLHDHLQLLTLHAR